MSEVIGIRTRMWIPNSSWQRSAIYEYTCHYYYHFIIIIFNPGRKSRDFKNCKKSVKLEWLLIRVIINRKKLSCNSIELKRCTTTDKRWNKKERSRSSPDNLAMRLPRSPTSSYGEPLCQFIMLFSLSGPSFQLRPGIVYTGSRSHSLTLKWSIVAALIRGIRTRRSYFQLKTKKVSYGRNRKCPKLSKFIYHSWRRKWKRKRILVGLYMKQISMAWPVV